MRRSERLLILQLLTVIFLISSFLLDNSVSLEMLRVQGCQLKAVSLLSYFLVDMEPALVYHFSLAAMVISWIALCVLFIVETEKETRDSSHFDSKTK